MTASRLAPGSAGLHSTESSVSTAVNTAITHHRLYNHAHGRKRPCLACSCSHSGCHVPAAVFLSKPQLVTPCRPPISTRERQPWQLFEPAKAACYPLNRAYVLRLAHISPPSQGLRSRHRQPLFPTPQCRPRPSAHRRALEPAPCRSWYAIIGPVSPNSAPPLLRCPDPRRNHKFRIHRKTSLFPSHGAARETLYLEMLQLQANGSDAVSGMRVRPVLPQPVVHLPLYAATTSPSRQRCSDSIRAFGWFN